MRRYFSLLLLLFFSVSSHAHPHSWIGNELKVNGDGTEVESLTMTWTFDPFSSAYALDGDFSVFDNEESAHKEALRLMRNLLNTHYLPTYTRTTHHLSFDFPRCIH